MADSPQPTKLCPSCGSTSQADANVCSTCGYNFHQGPYAQPPRPMAPPSYANPHYQANYPREGDQPSQAQDIVGILSLIFGIIAFPLICCLYMSIPCGIFAIILGAIGLKGRNRALAISGMICAGISIILTIALLIFAFSFGAYHPGSNPFG